MNMKIPFRISFPMDDQELEIVEDKVNCCLKNEISFPAEFSSPEILEGFFEKSFRALLLERVDETKKTVALMHSVAHFWKHFGNIHELLRNAGYNVLILANVPLKGTHFGFNDDPGLIFINTHMLNYLQDDIHFYLGYANKDYLPGKAKKLRIGHDIDFINHQEVWDLNQFLSRYIIFSETYDYIALSCFPDNLKALPKPMHTEAFQNFREPSFYKHTSKRIHFIPLGYPKLDQLIHHVEGQAIQGKKNLLYCPTEWNVSSYSVEKYGITIVENILEHFPSHTVTVRPHPLSREREEFLRLEEYFKDNVRVFINTDSSYLDLYAESVLMVTDESGTAETYTLATCKPVIYFRPMDQDNDSYFKVGYKAKSIEQLMKLIGDKITHKGNEAKVLDSLRKNSICNFTESETYLLECIEKIMNGSNDEEWIAANIL